MIKTSAVFVNGNGSVITLCWFLDFSIHCIHRLHCFIALFTADDQPSYVVGGGWRRIVYYEYDNIRINKLIKYVKTIFLNGTLHKSYETRYNLILLSHVLYLWIIFIKLIVMITITFKSSSKISFSVLRFLENRTLSLFNAK